MLYTRCIIGGGARRASRDNKEGLSFFRKSFLLVFVLVLFGMVFESGVVSGVPLIEFVDPTPSDGGRVDDLRITSFTEINVSITESDLDEMKYNWNGVNYSFYDNDLVLMYNFDNISALGENDTYSVDVSRYGNNGTWGNSTTGNISYVTGKYNNGIEFDGIDDYVDTGVDLSWSNVSNFSMAVWIKPNTVTGGHSILGKPPTLYEYTLYQTDQQVEFIYWTSTGTNAIKLDSSTNVLSVGQWTHAVVTYNGSLATLYLNGVEDINAISTGEFHDRANNMQIGTAYNGGANYFNGTIDEVRIWNRSLSANEINNLYYSNLKKYDTDKWSFYTNQTNLSFGSNTYFATASNSLDNENTIETRTVNVIFKTTQYYDDRKATAVWTGDDWTSANNDIFVNASNYAQNKKVVFSPGIITGSMGSSAWISIQAEIDEGFVSSVSHSVNHEGVPYTNTTLEVCDSRSHIIENLTLPWQNWFNSSEYLVGWIEPYSNSDSAVRGNLSECNYLCDRRVHAGVSSWASWNNSEGLYNRALVTISGDGKTLEELNNNFSEVYSNGGIYHLYMHPLNHNWSDSDIMPQHLLHIGNKTDVWYVGWGQLYMYHYLEDRLKPTMNLTTYNNQQIISKINVSGTERNKYGLSYPVTYAFALPSVWSNVFVFYKNQSSDNYTLMTEKTRNEYWIGIDAYRTNLSENAVYVSKSFPQEYNEFYLKIAPVLSTNFGGETTDLTTATLSNITNLILESASYGKISFSESVNLSAGGNLNTHVNISDNYISINSTALSELNKSATLILYNLTYTNPRVLKDGVVCPSSICTEVSYVGNNFTFTVTSFSTYSAEETPTTTTTETSTSGGTPTYYPTETNLQEGYSKQLAKNWKLKFEIGDESHQLKIDEINKTSETATVTVSSESQTKTLSVGEEWKVNLDGDGDYDLFVRLDNVTFSRAEVFIMEIDEAIEVDEDETFLDDDFEEVDEEDYWLFCAVVILVLIVGFLIWVFVDWKKKR